MRLLFFSDSHLAERPPASRNPTYADDVFAKLSEVKEIARTADVAIFGGDMFHAAHPPHAIVRRTIEMLRDWPCPLYIVVGNHDLPADGMAGLGRTALGVVLEGLAGTHVRLLAEDVLIKSPRDAEDEAIARAGSGTPHGPRDPYVQLSPGHWTPSIDGDATALMMGREISPSWKKVKIKIMHAMIMTGGKDHPFPCHLADEIDTDADIILCGHTHWATGPYTNKNGVLFVGPGSIARTQRSEGELKRQIGVSILDVGAFIESQRTIEDRELRGEYMIPSREIVRFIPLKSARPASEVFLDAVADRTQERDERFSGYVAVLETGLGVGDGVEEALAVLEKRAPIGVADLTRQYLRDAGL